jgi:hypothetical protein
LYRPSRARPASESACHSSWFGPCCSPLNLPIETNKFVEVKLLDASAFRLCKFGKFEAGGSCDLDASQGAHMGCFTLWISQRVERTRRRLRKPATHPLFPCHARQDGCHHRAVV